MEKETKTQVSWFYSSLLIGGIMGKWTINQIVFS